MDKIRIAYITKNLRVNGISAVILNYCLNLDMSKFDITIFAGKPICQDYVDRLKAAGINIDITPSKKGKNPFKYYSYIKKNITKKRFDMVHIHGNSATIAIELLITKINGIKKRIVHCHNTKCDNKAVHVMLKPIVKMLYSYGLACSKEAGQWMFGSKPFDILPNGFNTKNFIYNENNRMEVRKELGLKDELIIGHVGIFTDQKNHTFMLDAFNEVASKNNNAVLLFVGAGPNFDKIKELIKVHKYGNRIICYGETTSVNRLYDAMDVFFFPSKFEGLGIVLLEAQIKGLRCVISDVVPRKAILNEENVKTFSLDDEKEKWSNELLIKNSAEYRKEYYNKNEEKILEFDINKNVNNLEQIYLSLTK